MIDSQHQEPVSFEGHTAMGRPLSINTAYKRWELTAKRGTVIDTVAPLRPLRSPYFWGSLLATLGGVALLVDGEFLTGTLALLGFGLLGLPLSYFGASTGPQLRLTREGLALHRSARRRRPAYWTLPWDGFDAVRVDASRRPISLEVNERGQEALRGTRAKLDAGALRLPRLAIPHLHEAGPWLAEARAIFAGSEARLDDSSRPADAYQQPAAVSESGSTPESARHAEWDAQLVQDGQVTVRTTRTGAAVAAVFFLVLAAICGATLLLAPQAPPSMWNNPLAWAIVAVGALWCVACALGAAARVLRPTSVVIQRDGVRIGQVAVAWREVQEVTRDSRSVVLLVPVPAQSASVMSRLPALKRVGRSINQRAGERDGIRLPGLLAEAEGLRGWLQKVHRAARAQEVPTRGADPAGKREE